VESFDVKVPKNAIPNLREQPFQMTFTMDKILAYQEENDKITLNSKATNSDGFQ